MEYNISEAELPTMVVRYENKLILRSVITGQHLEDLGFAPVWDDAPTTPALQARRQRIEMEHGEALEALVRLYPCEEPVTPQTTQPPAMPQSMPGQSPQKKPVPLVAARAPSPLAISEAELPPCKVHRNYCCNYCNFCTQNPRSHLMHQRQVHGIRLSIHCCHHCQYASRYFQKLKRHVKMVHMGNSPGKSKIRNKTAARRVPKQKVTQAASSAQQHHKQAEPPNTAPAKPIQAQEPTKLPTEVPQKPKLLTQQTAAGSAMQPAKPPAVFKNPEAFFEAAYRNQLIQQQLQEQRFKEFVRISNELNKVTQPESSQAPAPQTTPNPVVPTMNPQQKVPAIQSMQKIKSPPGSSSPKLPAESKLSHSHVEAATPEIERKRMYCCRKCSYVTHIKSRYNKHVKYHSMPMIQCDKCKFRTTYKWNLTRHLRNHHGNGLYKCSVCSFSAHIKQSLTSHELNHHSPPVGHISRVHNKPFRRRRCRVGGSDLVQDMRAIMSSGKACLGQANILAKPKSEPIAADNLSSFPSTVGHECLKLLIKREAGTSSYSSTQTSKSTHTAANYAHEFSTTCADSKKSSSPSNSFPSSYSASPSSTCSNVSVVDHGIPMERLQLTENIPAATSQSATFQTAEKQQLDAFNSARLQYKALGTLNAQPQSPLAETQQFSYSPPESAPLVPSLPVPQPTLYSSSEDSASDSDPDIEDSDDTYSTISANETVPHGLHIAYDSSSPDRKSSSSDSPTLSECSSILQTTREESERNGFPESVTNVTSLEN